MTLSERLEAAVKEYQDAQQQLARWQERVIYLAGRIELLQELLKEETDAEPTKVDKVASV